MKKILGLMVIALVLGIATVGCNNKPPFVKLQAAVDSLNTEMQSTPSAYADSCAISYDELTNTVKYTMVVDTVNHEEFQAVAPGLEDAFIGQLAGSDEYGLAKEIADAKANVLVEIVGKRGGKFEMMVETATFVGAYKALHPDISE